MIEYLHLKNVGPAPEMELRLAPRLNLITGDNGLGKSFLLDVAWWALTGWWPAEVNPTVTSGLVARPRSSGLATIDFSFHAKVEKGSYSSRFDRRAEVWVGRPGRPANPGLVLYAQVDGGFSVWDPARNYWSRLGARDTQERQPAFVFSAREVWNGLRAGDTQLCNGLIGDWALWQKEGGHAFKQLSAALLAMSPSSEDPLVAGELGRLSVGDARWIPTLKTPYGPDVLLPVASAGVRRIVSLAYLLVWTWQEHVRAAALLDEPTTRQVTFLIDELECHLHPRWQRTIVRSLLEVMRGLAGTAAVQIVAATHSPMLLASVEPLFDAATDAWFDLDLVRRDGTAEVQLTPRPFVRRGTAGRWLTSQAFDLASEGRSIEAEKAIAAAEHILERHREKSPLRADEVNAVDSALRAVLPDVDRFWIRWSAVVDELKGAE